MDKDCGNVRKAVTNLSRTRNMFVNEGGTGMKTRIAMLLCAGAACASMAFCGPVGAAAQAKSGQGTILPGDGENAAKILTIFEGISQVPRCSKHEDAISEWLLGWAKERGLAAKADAHRNVLVSVPASKGFESRPAVVLQAHMDMVCQKTDDSAHDFGRDPITLVREGEWLRADKTTLGADDGMGIALALALAEDTAHPHPPLELLFTTDEEVDMSGAFGLSKDFFTGRRFINIDSENDDTVTIGSAGGVKSVITMPLAFSALDKGSTVLSLRIDGLLGGHSGVEIHKNRANANALVAEALSGPIPLRLADFSGGTADNAITRTAEAVFALSPDHLDALKKRLAAFEQDVRTRFPDEKQLALTLVPAAKAPARVIPEADSARVVRLIADIPQGVHEWSKQLPGLPETSNNIGVVRVEGDTLTIIAFQRSFSPQKLEDIAAGIEAAAARAGAVSKRRSTFPTWPPNPESNLYKKSLATYEALFKTPMKTEIIHAGLECGYVAESFAGMEIISIGPTMENVHTPRERVHVPSLERVSAFLQALLKDL